ncbi:MAG: hypothetical protein AB7V50_07405 [Vampirovibrionia bacterium]
MFKVINRLERFEQLPPEERKEVLQVAKAFIDDANCPLTLIGEKAGSLVVISKEEATLLRKHKDLFNSDKFKVVIESEKNTKTKQTCNVFVVNIDDQRKIINKHLELYKHRLNDKNLTPEKAENILFSENTPLFDINNNHDMVGITIGYPVSDSLLFKISRDIKQQLRHLSKTGDGNSNAANFLKLVEAMTMEKTHPFIQSFMDQIGIKKPVSPLGKTGGTYIFETWDADKPETQALLKKIPDAINKAQERIQTPEDALKIMLEN